MYEEEVMKVDLKVVDELMSNVILNLYDVFLGIVVNI